jgi:Sulfotransferase family
MKEKYDYQNENEGNYKYVFVCGLQRSGTSVLARNIGRLKGCTSFKNTGVLQDEGQYLQDVYPTDGEYGGTGRFGFDPRAHLTETSGLLTPQNVARLRTSWHSHWDKDKSICLEKTPGNLIMTRFLQAAFPNSYFIVVKRHPVAVSMATQRWKVSITSLHRMFEHCLRCYGIFEEDKKYLRRVYELRYEDYVENPGKYHQEIAAFIGTCVLEPPKEDKFRYVAQWPNPTGLRVPECAMEEVTAAHNKKYFDRWSNLLNNSLFKSYYRYIAMKYEPRVAKYGYSLTKDLGGSDEVLQGGRVSNAVGALCCLGADTGAFMWRLSVRSNTQLRVTAKAVLPEFVVTGIRQLRQRQSSNKERAEARG